MSRCFASSSKLSAKDYTKKKSNINMFCDLRTKFITNGYKTSGTPNACINDSGIISKFNSQTDQLNIKKGFEQFLSTNTLDLSKNYIGQKIKKHFCSKTNIPDISNVDISNNYTYRSPILTLATSGNTAQTFIIDASGSGSVSYINKYAEIKTNLGEVPTGTDLFPNNKKVIYELCGTDMPIRASGRMQVVVASELPPPILTGIEIIIV